MKLKNYSFFDEGNYFQWLYFREWGYNTIMMYYIHDDLIAVVKKWNLEMEILHIELMKFFHVRSMEDQNYFYGIIKL